MTVCQKSHHAELFELCTAAWPPSPAGYDSSHGKIRIVRHTFQGLYYAKEMAKWNLFSITGILCAQNLAETPVFGCY